MQKMAFRGPAARRPLYCSTASKPPVLIGFTLGTISPSFTYCTNVGKRLSPWVYTPSLLFSAKMVAHRSALSSSKERESKTRLNSDFSFSKGISIVDWLNKLIGLD